MPTESATMDRRERFWHWLFEWSVILKGIHAALEFLGGVAVLIVSPSLVMKAASALTADELSEDPHDPFASYLMHAASQFSVSFQHLAALYLISHGIVIGFLVWGLLTKRLWSYPLSIGVLLAFIAYQTYQYSIHPYWWLLGVTVLDVAVIFLTWHEYRFMKRHHAGR